MLEFENLSLLMPEMILGVTALVVMLGIAIKRSHTASFILTLLGTIAAFISLFGLPTTGHKVSTLFMIDGFGLFFSGLILVATILIAFFSYAYLKHHQKLRKGEYYVLLLLGTVGAMTLTIANHFISFFLGMVLMSVSMYALIGYLRKTSYGIEAAIKYLIMAGVSTAIMLFGFALVYLQTGTMELQAMRLVAADNAHTIFFTVGMAMIVIGIGFEMALVPFHSWTPDVYDGASAPAAAFVATISKGAILTFLLRFFIHVNGQLHANVWWIFAVFAILSMLIGNILGLRQTNLKRLLAYSSIGHLGYMLVAVLAINEFGVEAVAFYLIAYFVGMLAAFGIIGYLTEKEGELRHIDDYRGLFWRKPFIAVVFTVVLLSLAGIPLTAGFFGKFLLLRSGMGPGLWGLVITLVVSSAIGLFYYLKVVLALYRGKKEDSQYRVFQPLGSSVVVSLILAGLFVLLFWIGSFPVYWVDMIHGLVRF